MSAVIRKWMRPAQPAVEPPFIAIYRNRFHCGPGGGTLDLQYSADERGMFFLDGEKAGEGPERGTIQKWYWGRPRHFRAGNWTPAASRSLFMRWKRSGPSAWRSCSNGGGNATLPRLTMRTDAPCRRTSPAIGGSGRNAMHGAAICSITPSQRIRFAHASGPPTETAPPHSR